MDAGVEEAAGGVPKRYFLLLGLRPRKLGSKDGDLD